MYGKHDAADAWAAAHGSVRGSSLLRAGAVLAGFGVLLEAAGTVVAGDMGWTLSITAWSIWTLALLALATGFFWIGLNPVLSRVGIGVGAVHLLLAAYLLARIFAQVPLAFPPKALVVGRLLLIVVFAVVERVELGRRTAGLLAAAALLVLVKALLPVFGFDPPLAPAAAAVRDAVPALLLAAAIFDAGRIVRRRENLWARHQVSAGGAGFEDFNNPFNEGQRARARHQK